jgi:hypothetical protein
VHFVAFSAILANEGPTMDDIASTAKSKRRISVEEMQRRKEAVRWADSHNRIEGLFRSPETNAVYEAFVRGEIDFDDILPRLNAIHHRS